MAKYISVEEELIRASYFISNFFIREGYHVDFTLSSFIEIDSFINEKLYLLLDNDNSKNYIFSLSAYIGEVLRLSFKGKWNVVNSLDFNNQATVSFKDGSSINPFEITFDVLQKKYTLQSFLSSRFAITN